MIELNKISKKEIEVFLKSIEGNFSPPLSERLDLVSYSVKLFEKASSLFIYVDNIPVSGIFFYNDPTSRSVYIPIVGTLTEFQGRGYFQHILDELFNHLKDTEYNLVKLETWQGSKALNYYIKNGFKVEERTFDRNGNYSIKLFKRINQQIESFNFSETPLYKDNTLSQLTSNTVYVKRDDLFPVMGGGSKGRKLHYILNEAIKDGVTTVITCGSNQSSHLRTTATLCAQLGLKSVLIIHDTPLEKKTANIKVIDFFADHLIYCDLKDVKTVMDQAVNDAIAASEKPLYIYGGGHCLEGTYAYYKAVRNLQESNVVDNLDYVFVASGTGTTQAGLHIGMSQFYSDCQVIGISISRKKKRGKEVIEECMEEFARFQMSTSDYQNKVVLDDSFLDGGYGHYSEENKMTIDKFSKKLGMTLDQTYSGKAFLGMLSHLKNIKNKNVLFWNTGSSLNFIENL